MSNSVALMAIQQNVNPAPKIELPKVNIDMLKERPICYNEYQLPPNYIKYVDQKLSSTLFIFV